MPTAQDQSVRALSEDLRLACMRISRRVRFESDHEVAPHQFSVLARLEAGPLTPRALAEIEKVSAPSMTRTLTCLVDDGLLDRSDHPDDGRQVLISLTDAGRETLRRTRARRDAWMVSRVAELSETDRATLTAATQILDRIAAR
ncbi:MarR family transcriptional regulator [Marihabitans asiaticum]|uniref:DNA-binding MarR family transcriptional regulator n=1 Tax=Marihabitans asiaticum TaxID=415218 RepID=A0A560WHE5_9MICO|nr:MarR family transcriptional regulator [Marihabitans asiaticum]TWD17082.1 DNA-binding MarR family transcriptional regulator [Marihabitans asiaticum]